MPENSDSIKHKASINLSRNSPTALVVGGSGFIGSHITKALLDKNIEVIVVDDFSSSKKDNLEEVTKDNKFHLINLNAEKLELTLDRLDYIFITAGSNWDMKKILELSKENNSKTVLISYINLYESEVETEFKWFKKAESELSEFSSEYKLNSRVIRLGPVYGPKMNFNIDDPLVKLISSSIENKLQKEADSLEFSSRALYIDDAVNLIIKSMLAGGTALKIFDGVGEPIKVSEIKQVLLDPLWYENRNFKPSQLPPWDTPNLEKTKKQLNWQPKSNLVTSLRETLSYFKDHEVKIPVKTEIKEKPKFDQHQLWEQEKLRRLSENEESEKVKNEKGDNKKNIEKKKSSYGNKFLVLIGLLIIGYGFIYPIITFGWGVINFRQNLKLASDNLQKGEFDKSLANIDSARNSLQEASNLIYFFKFLEKVDFTKNQYQNISKLRDASNNILDASQKSVEGSKTLYQSLLNISGQNQNSTNQYFLDSEVSFNAADNLFSKALIDLKITKTNLPFIDDEIKLLTERTESYDNLTKKAKSLSELLPQIIGTSQENYLVILEDENQLRSYGGVIVGVVRVDFDQGKIKKIEAIDPGQLTGKSIDEPDFANLSKQLIGSLRDPKISGVVGMDLKALSEMLTVMGGVKINGSEDINGDNLIPRAASQKLSTLAYQSLLTEFLNKIFFVPNMNWVELTLTLGNETENKDMEIYLSDPKLFSSLLDQNLTGTLPKQTTTNKNEDLLGFIESNIGGNPVNYFIQKQYDLETGLLSDGSASHRLRVNYQNNSKVLSYKAQVKIYLPNGSKLNQASFGETPIKNFTTTSDYNRTVYTFVITIDPGSSRVLSLEYNVPLGLNIADKKTPYVLNILKQIGTPASSFSWNFTKPIIYSTQTQLSKDLQFKIGL